MLGLMAYLELYKRAPGMEILEIYIVLIIIPFYIKIYHEEKLE